MSVYLWMLVGSCFFISMYEKGRKYIFLILSFLCLFAVAAFRFHVGTDYGTYAELFQWINEGIADYIEIGYRIFNRIVFLCSGSSLWVFAISSFLTLLIFYRCILSYSKDRCMSLFLFIAVGYYFFSLNLVRQYIAIALCFYAQKYIRRSDLIKFLFFVLLAATFHKSALVMIPFYWILRLRLKVSYYMVICILSGAIACFHSSLLNVIFTFVYSDYKGSEFLEYHLSYSNLIIFVTLTAGCMFYYKQLLKQNRQAIIYINAAFYSLLIFTFFGWLGTFSTRIAAYLSVYTILIIPEIISAEGDRKIRTFYKVAVYLIFLCFLFIFFKENYKTASGILPYQTIFSVK